MIWNVDNVLQRRQSRDGRYIQWRLLMQMGRSGSVGDSSQSEDIVEHVITMDLTRRGGHLAEDEEKVSHTSWVN